MSTDISTKMDYVRRPQEANFSPFAKPGKGLPVDGEVLPAQTDIEHPVPGIAEMRELTNAFNASIQATKHQLQFSLDDASGKTIIKVIDSATDKVIRQFPPEQVVAVARAIKASLSEDGGEPLGVLLEAKG